MSKWISHPDLLARWKILDFESIDYLKQGLQPYSRYGLPLSCPILHHARHHKSNELSILREELKRMESQPHLDQSVVEEILPFSESEAPTADPSLYDKRIQEIREQEAKVFEERMAIEDDDPGFSSWKYFIMPELDQDVESILEKLKGSNYRLKDVLEIEKKHGLEPSDQIGAEKTKSISDGKVEKKLRPSQRHRKASEVAAEKLWAENPDLRIATVSRSPEIMEACEGRTYKEKTLRNWVKHLCPNPRPGRPKKTD
jgi:hypothetical protein